MAFVLFHNIGTGNPLVDLVLLLLVLVFVVISATLTIYGFLYTVRNWKDFSPTWRKILSVIPVIAFLPATILPTAISGWLSFPFGVFGGFIFIIVASIYNFPPPEIMVTGGIVLNSLGFIGLFRYLERRKERNAEFEARSIPSDSRTHTYR
jgi:hypothetical protein